MRVMLGIAAMALLAACSPASEKAAPEPVASVAAPTPVAAVSPAAPAPTIEGIPAGKYVTDKMHSTIVFTVDHMSFSHYTAKFNKFEGQLELDPKKPADAKLTATIDPTSLDLSASPAELVTILNGPEFFDTKKFKSMTFKSTKVEITGPTTANVTGDFTMHGVTRPVTLAVTYNNGYPGMLQDPQARIGFSAKGSLKRSEFGMSMGLPPPGSTMGVGDEVTIAIETEMLGPPFTPPGSDVTLTPKPK